MEYISYQSISQNLNELNTGSYLNNIDYSLFIKGFTGDLWYGYSANDVIEIGVFDYSQNLIAWDVINQDKQYSTNNYTFTNALDFPVTYSYSQLISDFILHKNEKVLVNLPEQLSSSFGITEGSYILTYNFIREMAGTIKSPLVIKEISPSGKEIKLVPVGNSTFQYDAFCKKKVLISDVSPLYIQLTNEFPYSQIYNQIYSSYQSEINTLKTLFFLKSDGDVIVFLKNIYEDFITYTKATVDSNKVVTTSAEQIIRIQGIKTYFNNYLMLNVNQIVDFKDISDNFHAFVIASIERKFVPVGTNLTNEYVNAKQFIYDFFVKYFYDQISDILASTYIEKYFSYLRNAINVGNGRILPIINHDALDERIELTDPLTLIVKLQQEIPSDITTGTTCWVSNISLVPYVINAIIKSPGTLSTFKIGSPNFSTALPNTIPGNVNKSYTATDLDNGDTIDNELSISKKQTELNIDYTRFNNFVIFSSAVSRLNIFKNKIIDVSNLTSSLLELKSLGTSYLVESGSLYPYYDQEYDNIQTQLNDIMTGFDGYESYLYRNGTYQYSSGSFVSSSYVTGMDTSASYYDKYNRDNLINNTPQHIIIDEDNDDYLIFLSMMGHYFDELYAYITSIPSEKSISEGTTETFTRTVIDYMLESFGWKLDDILEQSSLIDNYLTSNEIDGLNSMSTEDRIKTIRNRILINLPRIYKTKGTEEAIKLILSCYGIPSTLLNIREYGGINYEDDNASYTQYEKIFMYQWDTSSKYNFFSAEYPAKIRTIEYKFSIPSADPYSYNVEQIQWGVVSSNETVLSGGFTVTSGSGASGSGIIHGGFIKEHGQNLGRVFFSVGYQGNENFKIYSDIIPIFDGNVYSVMVRRNDYDSNYESNINTNAIPAKYDLYVARNDSGRSIISSTSSYINYRTESNYSFDTDGYLMIGGWFSDINGQGYTGTLDKFMCWIDPITDDNFQDHVNNPNSYAFSGSRDCHKSLILRMHTDYPFNMRTISPLSSTGYIINGNDWMGTYKNANSYYAVPSTAFSNYTNETGHYQLTTNNISQFICWAPWSGSQELVYNTSSCKMVSQSCYPYQFAALDYPCTHIISKYGPNKFRNEKVKYVSQLSDVRFDNNARSTYNLDNTTSPDSNIIGFFADPHDFKNKDITRYFGNYNFMDVIGSPSNEYLDNYGELKILRKKYSDYLNWQSGSNPRVGEMMTLYKLYFNKSIFESIRNLTPARSNVLTGVLIEPSILERPKYESKEISNELNSGSVYYFDITASKYFRDPNTKMVSISQDPIYAEFNLDTSLLNGSYFDSSSIPVNLTIDLNFSYINDPSRIYPANYLKNDTDVCDLPDKYQFGHFGSNAFIPIDDDTNGKMPFDMIYETQPTGSNKCYLLKKWNTHTIWYKDGPWNRTTNPNENTYVTNSIQLYEYISVSDSFFNSITDHSQLEIVRGYPRNHYTHKNHVFSPFRIQTSNDDIYMRSQQTITSTIGSNGLNDGTPPVQSFEVSNVNVIQSDNVINQ